MKRIAALTLIVLLALSLAACGSSTGKTYDINAKDATYTLVKTLEANYGDKDVQNIKDVTVKQFLPVAFCPEFLVLDFFDTATPSISTIEVESYGFYYDDSSADAYAIFVLKDAKDVSVVTDACKGYVRDLKRKWAGYEDNYAEQIYKTDNPIIKNDGNVVYFFSSRCATEAEELLKSMLKGDVAIEAKPAS